MTHVSILATTKCATSKPLPVLTSSRPARQIKGIFCFVFHLSINSTSSFQPVSPSKSSLRGNRGKDAVGLWSLFPPLLYQLDVAGGERNSLRPHQWLLYFPTCQVNIWEGALALEAQRCSPSSEYEPKCWKCCWCTWGMWLRSNHWFTIS